MQFKQSILLMDKCDIFELVEALYTYCILWHGGQASELYALQCEISNHYSPGIGFSESDVENENMYYHDINEDNARHIWNRVEYVLENRWNDMY